MYSHSLRRCTEKGFRTAMDNLQMRLDEAILLLEKVYLEFTPAMMANSLDPVLAFKCRLEKSHDEVIQCRTAIDRLISSNAEHSDVGSKDYVERCRLIDEKTFTMVTEVGQRISLFESKLPGVVKVIIPIVGVLTPKVGVLILVEVVSPAALKKRKLYLNIN